MPAVNLTQETFEALQRIAARSGKPVDAAAEEALQDYVSVAERDLETWRKELMDAIAEIRAGVPPGISPEEIERDIDQATREAWEERQRAGGH